MTAEPTYEYRADAPPMLHRYDWKRGCGGCGESVSRVGIDKLAYVFDRDTDDAGNAVLAERVWHRECLAAGSPDAATDRYLAMALYGLAQRGPGSVANRERIATELERFRARLVTPWEDCDE